MMQVMFGACLRVSETIGLTWSDVDMKNREIHAGGRSGFIFNTKHGRPIMPAGVNSFLKNIVNAYNKKRKQIGRRREARAGVDASYFIAYPSSYGMYQIG